jgi:hypothetical protein
MAIATMLLFTTFASAEDKEVPKFTEIDVNDDGFIDRKEVKSFEAGLARTRTARDPRSNSNPRKMDNRPGEGRPVGQTRAFRVPQRDVYPPLQHPLDSGLELGGQRTGVVRRLRAKRQVLQQKRLSTCGS